MAKWIAVGRGCGVLINVDHITIIRKILLPPSVVAVVGRDKEELFRHTDKTRVGFVFGEILGFLQSEIHSVLDMSTYAKEGDQ